MHLPVQPFISLLLLLTTHLAFIKNNRNTVVAKNCPSQLLQQSSWDLNFGLCSHITSFQICTVEFLHNSGCVKDTFIQHLETQCVCTHRCMCACLSLFLHLWIFVWVVKIKGQFKRQKQKKCHLYDFLMGKVLSLKFEKV